MIFFLVSFRENERSTGLSVFLSVKRYFRSLPKLPKANDENEKMMIRDDEFTADDDASIYYMIFTISVLVIIIHKSMHPS